MFDAHSIDGKLSGYTLDDLIGFRGFAAAMVAVDWLDESGAGPALPEFHAHNDQSAKRRAMDKNGKQSGRLSASEADKKRTREEI